MWVVGGSDESGPVGGVWRLDLDKWEWSEVKVDSALSGEWDGRELHGMAVEESGERVWVCGGRSENGVLTTRHALQLNGSTAAAWSQIASAPARCAHSLLTLQANSAPTAAQSAASGGGEEAKEQVTTALDSLSLTQQTLPSLLLFGGTDGLTFYNDLTILMPPTPPATTTTTTTCPTCNGPLGCHKLGGTAKSDNNQPQPTTDDQPPDSSSAAAKKGAGKKGRKRGKGGVSGWPAHRFAHSLTGVRLRDGRAGYLLFGGMDEERDMNDAHLLTIETIATQQ